MNKPITITATVAAWVTPGYQQRELMRAVEKRNGVTAVNAVALWGPPEATEFGSDYTRIGEAEVTLRLLPRDEQTRLAVTALQRKLEEERAAWLTRQQQILEEISKLQAITFDAEAA